MADHTVVRCPNCAQKYKLPASAIGRKALCKHCQTAFVVEPPPVIDEDTVLAWMATDEDDDADTVPPPPTPIRPPPQKPSRPPKPAVRRVAGAELDSETGGLNVRLERVDGQGAHFDFPAASLTQEKLRNAFPRRCVGCGTKQKLEVHLIYWPEKMDGESASHWEQRVDNAVGKLDAFGEKLGHALLAQLPKLRRLAPPFNLPFPIFACEHCHAGREVRGHVRTRGQKSVCRLTIASLAVAVHFFRNTGGRDRPEYQQLVEARDKQHDAWRTLDGDIRQRLAHWFEPRAGERFVAFYPDAEFSKAEAGLAGLVLTDRRLVYKKYAANREYPLADPGRLEITTAGPNATCRIFEEGQRPALAKLAADHAKALAAALRSLRCDWTILG